MAAKTVSDDPIFMDRWDYSLNAQHDPSQIAAGSVKVADWVCEHGHKWQQPIRELHRTVSKGLEPCRVCSFKVILPGFNDLRTLHPELIEEYDHEKNETPMSEVSPISRKNKLYWVCSKGHSYVASPGEKIAKFSKSKSRGCAYCAGRKIDARINSLAATHPEIAAQLHPTKNSLKASEILSTSHKETYIWVCAKGHEWSTTPRHRTVRGQGCPYCAGNRPIQNSTDLVTTHPALCNEWDFDKNDKGPDSYTQGSEQKVWWLCDKGHSFDTQINNRTSKGSGCPTCAAGRSISRGEEEMLEYVKSVYGGPVVTSDRSVLKPYEIDIYLPDLKVGFEFNGVYWHNELHKPRSYHADKHKLAVEAGIQLIQVWEDEWVGRQEIVKSLIAHKLGVSQVETVYARKTRLVEDTYWNVKSFLNKNHIQGEASGTHYLSLCVGDELVAVMVLKKTGVEGEYDISRYATSKRVPGGFTKLLKHAVKLYSPEKLISFSDNCVSDGGMYESNGFVREESLKPDYMYVVGNERKHKFGYRLKRFKNDSELLYEEGLTERQLAALNKLNRIWDAGKVRWVFTP